MSAESYWIARADAATARAERAEAAIKRITAFAAHCQSIAEDDPDGRLSCASVAQALADALVGKWHADLAALDSTDLVEAAPEEPEHRAQTAGQHWPAWTPHAPWPTGRGQAPAATHPDVPAPGRSGEEKRRCTCYKVDVGRGTYHEYVIGGSHDCPRHGSDSGLPVDGEERTDG